MKYHSTKKSVITITIIIILLLCISAIGIFILNAKTPVQAVNEAIFSNLEMPNGYSLEIEDINESFLVNQNIKTIKLMKNGENIIEISDLKINQSIYNYFQYIFFDKKLNLKLSAEHIDVNLNSDISDLATSLSKIKIKDNTIAIQSKLDKKSESSFERDIDFQNLIDQIISEKNVDLSLILDSDFFNNDISVDIKSGNIEYTRDSRNFSSSFINLNFKLRDNRILNLFNCDFLNLNIVNGNSKFEISDLKLSYEDRKIALLLNDFNFINNDFNFKVKSGDVFYDLEKINQVFLDLNSVNLDYDVLTISSKILKSQIKTNFKDFSITLFLEILNFNYDKKIIINYNEANLGLSYVNDKISFYYNNESDLSLNFNNNNYLFNDIDLSLFSSKSFFNKINLKIGDLKFDINDINNNFSQINITGNASINDSLLLNDGKLDFNKIKNLDSAYNNLLLNVKSEIMINTINHNIESDFETLINLDDNFNTFSSSIFLNNLIFDNLKQKISSDINIQGPIELKEGNIQTIEADLNYGDFIQIKAIGNIENSLANNEINTIILFNDLPSDEFFPYINEYFPPLKNYIDNSTKIKGSFNYVGNLPVYKNQYVQGDINSTLLIKNSVFLDNNYDLSFNINTSLEDSYLSFDNLSISLFNYRLAFKGNYSLTSRIINGKVNIEDINKDKELMYVNLIENNIKKSTSFDLYINSLNNFNINGSFFNLSNSLYEIQSNISFAKDNLDLDIIGDLENLEFKAISNEEFDFNLIIDNQIELDLNFNNLLIKSLDNSIFEGNLLFNYKSDESWKYTFNEFILNYNNRFKLIFDGDITQNSINLNKIDYNNLKYDTYYHGTIDFKGPKYLTLFKSNLDMPYTLNLSYGDDISQRIEASLFNEGEINNIFLNVSNFNIARLFNNDSEILLDTRIIGNTDFSHNNDIIGKIEILETGAIDKANNNINEIEELDDTSILSRIFSTIPFINLPTNNKEILNLAETDDDKKPIINFKTNLKILDDNYLLENLNLSLSNIDINNSNINFNTKENEIKIISNIKKIRKNIVADQQSSIDVDFLINFSSFLENIKNEFSIDTFDYNSINSLYNKLRNINKLDYSLFNNVNGHLKIKNIDLFVDIEDYERLWDDSIDESVYLSDIDTTFSVYDSVLNFTSNNINSKFNLADKTGTININDDINLASDIDFEYKNNQLNAYFNNIIFPISLLNKIINVKLTKFYGDPFKGNILIEDILNKPKYYGEVSSTNFKIKTLYTQNNEISAPNISVILNEDEIYANRTKAIYFNEEENKYINFFVSSKIIMPNFDFDFFELDVLASDFIPVYIPLLGQNLTMLGEGKNNFNFSTDGNTSYIAGDLVVENGVIYSGVDLPSWIVSRQEVNGDLRIITAENNTFYYPYVDNPILKITMANNQKINVKFDSLTKTYSPTGNIDILQGEIFYFQKNFYINNGSLALNVNSNTKRLEPVVSLDATLREIDSNGDAVDINLSLENSTLYNLNPNFTSVPIKTQQEIMNILGQSFSTSANNETVASLASAATSVFSSLGYLETGGVASLNNTIANSLNLDFFSLKSNIVENLILQTFIEDPRYSSYSPLARYLNNTTIFMGKYLNNNSKFQILINLLANDDDDKTSFITSDLSLDLEMSYEVDTELAKFSFFTNPNQLSILEILDTIGFSVTKTIDFR